MHVQIHCDYAHINQTLYKGKAKVQPKFDMKLKYMTKIACGVIMNLQFQCYFKVKMYFTLIWFSF